MVTEVYFQTFKNGLRARVILKVFVLYCISMTLNISYFCLRSSNTVKKTCKHKWFYNHLTQKQLRLFPVVYIVTSNKWRKCFYKFTSSVFWMYCLRILKVTALLGPFKPVYGCPSFTFQCSECNPTSALSTWPIRMQSKVRIRICCRG